MIYAYVRVSSLDQNLGRQLKTIKKEYPDIKAEHVFADKQSGKDFNRPKKQSKILAIPLSIWYNLVR